MIRSFDCISHQIRVLSSPVMSRGGRGGKRRGDAMTFSLETIGFNRGDTLPAPVLTPPANFPTIDSKPLMLHTEEVDNYLLTLKQDLRQNLMTSKYFINPTKEKPKVERYSDKYENIVSDMAVNDDLPTEWRLFPSELWPKNIRKSEKKAKTNDNKNVIKRLDDLIDKEKDDKSETEDSDKEAEDVGSDGEVPEEDVEDIEEGTDYTHSYFDNGEQYLDESDDNADEGPTY